MEQADNLAYSVLSKYGTGIDVVQPPFSIRLIGLGVEPHHCHSSFTYSWS
jgi:hypothetical protein